MNKQMLIGPVIFAVTLAISLCACAVVPTQDPSEAADDPAFAVLVFSKTAGFRHGSIPAGIAAVEKLGKKHGFAVEKTEDASKFTPEWVKQFDAVIFLNTTGDVFNDEQQKVFEQYIQQGGGYVGIHAASDTEYDWPWYGKLVGAYFSGHPRVQKATIDVVDNTHISTKHLSAKWERTDEWYNFHSPPKNVTVLMKLDESSYEGGTNGDNHPIAWYHEFDGGRAFYTGGGHTNESFEEPAFLQHLLGGIIWAADAIPADH